MKTGDVVYVDGVRCKVEGVYPESHHVLIREAKGGPVAIVAVERCVVWQEPNLAVRLINIFMEARGLSPNSEPVPCPEPACECGAGKLGHAPKSPGHATWCPVHA